MSLSVQYQVENGGNFSHQIGFLFVINPIHIWTKSSGRMDEITVCYTLHDFSILKGVFIFRSHVRIIYFPKADNVHSQCV